MKPIPETWLTASVCIFCWAAGLAAESSTTNPDHSPLETVYGIKRPQKGDLVLLGNGARLTGSLMTESFALRTAYGQVELKKKWVAGVDLAYGTLGVHTVTLVNGDRLSGFLEPPAVEFQPEVGGRETISVAKISRVILHVADQERAGISSGRRVGLKNGDVLTGEVRPGSFSVSTTNGPARVEMKEMLRLATGAQADTPATITLRNGRVLQGKLDITEVSFHLAIGPTLALSQEGIDFIVDGSSAPLPAVHAASFAGSSVPADARSAATNLDGLVWIGPGEFVMGSPTEEVGREVDEGPQTKVIIPRGFWIGRCEVTQGEYQQLMGTNPSNTTGDLSRPVEKVSWFECVEYCARLTAQAGAAGKLLKGYAYRLPTEAEWEYACRAGTTTRFSYGEDKNGAQLGDYAWFTQNSESMPHPVGKRRPNPWGLYDMHGNVWEWCLDRWDGALPGGTVTNSATAGSGSLRVARGGSWLYEPKACRSANRDDYSPFNRCSDLGFRVVLAPVQ